MIKTSVSTSGHSSSEETVTYGAGEVKRTTALAEQRPKIVFRYHISLS
jgi:hypothetical protein